MEWLSDRRISPESYVLLVLAAVGYFLFMFSWFSAAAYLQSIMLDVGLSSTQAGAVTGAVQLSYIPLSLMSGVAIDRLGSRNSLTIGLVVIGTAHVLRGLAGGFVSLLVPTLLLGMGGTAVTFGLPKLVSELFPADRSGSMSSVYMVGATLGVASAFGLGRPAIGPLAGGWRPFFVGTGVLVVGFALFWTATARYLWGRVDRYPEQADDQTFTLESIRADIASVFTHRGLLLLVLIGTMRLSVSHGLSAWLPTILESRGLAIEIAGTITSLFVVVRIFGIVTVPAVSERLGTRRLVVVACGGVGTIGLVGLLAGTGILTLLGSLALVGAFLIGGLAPLVRAIPIELDGIGPRLTAVATGLVFTVGQVGGFLGPFLIGALRDLTGSFDLGLGLLVAGGAVTVVAGYVMDDPADSGESTSTVGGD